MKTVDSIKTEEIRPQNIDTECISWIYEIIKRITVEVKQMLSLEANKKAK